MAKTIADKIGAQGVIDALAVFIKQKQAKAKGEENTKDKQHKETNSIWAKQYLIQVHGFITIWKAKSDNKRQVKYKC